MKKMLLRIGAIEYEPSPTVKQHTLDIRLQESLLEAKIYEVREKKACAEELLNVMKTQKIVDFVQNNRYRSLLQKLIGTNQKKLKKFCGDSKDEQRHQLTQFLDQNTNQLNALLKANAEVKQGGDWKYQENALILKTPILCTTLAMAGIEKLEQCKDMIDYLIVDEACQAIEQSCLIPFELGPRRVILVGDQNQLPATTFSENADKTMFSRSLFERLLLSGYEKTMLKI